MIQSLGTISVLHSYGSKSMINAYNLRVMKVVQNIKKDCDNIPGHFTDWKVLCCFFANSIISISSCFAN